MNLQFLVNPLTQLFDLINSGIMTFVTDKGLAYFLDIFIFTLLLKTLLLPLQIKSTKSMVKMNEIQPKMKEIQEKYKNDPKKMQEKQMELYKEAGANPLGGCLPMLLQMPIFMAMYAVIYNYPGFKDTSITFLGVILANKNNLILAVISGATTYASSKVLSLKQTPSTTDSKDPNVAMQKNMTLFMSIFMGYISYTVKAGFVFYWIISNVIGFLQSYFIVNRIRDKEQAKLSK